VAVPNSIHKKSPLRTNPATDYAEQQAPMNFTNMNNPSTVRHIPPKEEDGQGQFSGYKSLREKSPVRSGSPMMRNNESAIPGNINQTAATGGDGSATRFASVSTLLSYTATLNNNG